MFQGGQFNDSSGVGTTSPGVSLYHEGMDLVAVVSTGDDVWKLQVQTCKKIVFLMYTHNLWHFNFFIHNVSHILHIFPGSWSIRK